MPEQEAAIRDQAIRLVTEILIMPVQGLLQAAIILLITVIPTPRVLREAVAIRNHITCKEASQTILLPHVRRSLIRLPQEATIITTVRRLEVIATTTARRQDLTVHRATVRQVAAVAVEQAGADPEVHADIQE
jgi:hypothetical protein